MYQYIYIDFDLFQYDTRHIYTYFILAGGDPINGEEGDFKKGKHRSASTRSPKHEGQDRKEVRRSSLQQETTWKMQFHDLWNNICFEIC